MADNILSAILTADGREFSKTITQLTDQYQRFQKGLQSATGVDSIARINKAMEAINQRVTGLKSFTGFTGLETGLQKVENRSFTARFAVQNLGNVIRDIPFAAANPAVLTAAFDHIVASFTQLKLEAGSTGGALKLLGSSIAGGGGLLIGFNLVSTAIALFAGRLFGANKEIDETKKKIEELIKPIEDVRAAAAGGVEGEIAKVQILSAAVLDQTKSYTERNNALIQLQGINKNYFGDIDLESSKLLTLEDRVKEYTKALVAAAVVKAFEQDIGNVGKELGVQEQKLAKLTKTTDDFNAALTQSTLIGGGGTQLSQGFAKATKAQQDQIEVVDKLKTHFNELFDAMKLAQTEALKFKPLEVPDPKNAEDKIKEFINRARALFERFPTLGRNISPIDDLLDTAPEKLAKAKAIINEFNEILAAGGRRKLLLFAEIDPFFEIEQVKNSIREEINKEVGKLAGPEFKDSIPTVKVPVDLILSPRSDNKAESELEKQAKDFATIFTNAMVEAFSSIGEGIGKAISGDSFKDIFSGIFISIGQAMKDLGKFLIGASKLIATIKKALQEAFLGNPIAGIALGVLLIAAGTALQKSVQFKATGGPVVKGQPYIVGEVGRELFVPEQSGFIVPANQLGSGGGQGAMNVNIGVQDVVIEGTKIRIILDRVNKQQGIA